MEETIICTLCLEPIFNHICVNCLENSVEKFLGNSEFLEEFKKFSENLKKKFESSFEKEKCIKCKLEAETIFCPYCYSKEVFDFLSTKNEELAKNFIKFFNFDFLGNGYASQTILTRNWLPVILAEKKEDQDLNICENCGNQCDDLRDFNGSYICGECEDEGS
ncbi:MAG: hypothetical protein QW451_00210 [Candidatus Aenigmatarchaeota archaeon]